MDASTYILLLLASVAAGVMNTVGGGGSILTIPVMIFAGINPNTANATNRIGVIAQNFTAIWRFRRGGVKEDGLAWPLIVVGLPGCWIGARLAASINPKQFEFLLGILMLPLLVLILARPKPKAPAEGGASGRWSSLGRVRQAGLLVSFFFLGIYGGFIQAGIGIMIIIVLSYAARLDLVRSNYVKLAFILVQQIFAFGVFLTERMAIDWWAGVTLVAGQSLGAYWGSWVALKVGERWIMVILVVSILLSSGKLLKLY